MPAYPRFLGTIIAATAMPAITSPRSQRRSYVRAQPRIGAKRLNPVAELAGASTAIGGSVPPPRPVLHARLTAWRGRLAPMPTVDQRPTDDRSPLVESALVAAIVAAKAATVAF